MVGRKMEFIYMMSVGMAYVDKTQKNNISNLWHIHLGHVNYKRLKVMMKKVMLKDYHNLKFEME